MPKVQTAMRYCHKCGAEIPKGSTYCKVCNTKWQKPGKF